MIDVSNNVRRSIGRAARRVRERMLPAALVVLAACDSTTSPDAAVTLDTQAALQDYQTLDRIFASEGWAGFSALAGRTPLAARANVASVAALANVSEGTARHFALRLFADMADARPPQPSALTVPIVSDTIRGRTFTYDAATDHYVVNPGRTGAPANGVRFVMYAVDASDRPIATQEIGYVDLLDEGSASGNDVSLRLVAVKGATTVLNYRTIVAARDGGGRIDVDGFAVDGQSTLDFSISAEGEEVGGVNNVEVHFDLRVDQRGFRIEGAVSGVENGADGEGRIDLTVSHRDQTLRVDMDGDGATLNGEIAFNGNTFVTVSGDAQSPTLRGASGNPITGEELLVVLHVIDIADDVFDLVKDLVQPVDNLVALGWVL